jgi:hypothetical protein
VKNKFLALISLGLFTWILIGCMTITIQHPTPTSIPATPQPLPTITKSPLPSLTPSPTSAPSKGGNSIKIFLIALEDNGTTGKKIGCNDSVVPVSINIEPTLGVLRASFVELLKLEGQSYYGLSVLYNSLYQSKLSIVSLNIVNREAILNLKGTLASGGVCDDPRIQAQLEETALQFNTIDRVSIFINGIPLAHLLSGQG